MLKIFDKIDDNEKVTDAASVCLLASDSYSVIRQLPDSITIAPNIKLSSLDRSQVCLPQVESITIDNCNAPIITVLQRDNLKKIVFKRQLEYLPYIIDGSTDSILAVSKQISIDFSGHTPKNINLGFYKDFKNTFINVDFDALDKLARSQESDYEARLDSFKKKYDI